MFQQLKNKFITLFFVALLSSLIPFLALAADPTNIVVLEENPTSSFLMGTVLYVISTEKNRMYLVSTTSNKFYTTIIMDSGPTLAIVHNDKIYVTNSQDKTVYVYYSTGTYKTSTSVGTGPIGLVGVGSRVYALSFDDTISVIDSVGDSVLKRVTLYAGTPSPFSTVLGNRIFIHHPNSNSISVFNTGTNSIVKNFPVGMSPQSSVLIGKSLYVINSKSNDISIVDTDTYTISKTISVGVGPFSALLVGSKLYVLNKGDNTISVLDTTKNTLTKTIIVGKEPASMIYAENLIYTMNLADDSVSVLDTKTDTVIKTLTVGDAPLSATLVGKKLYVNNSKSKSLSIIHTVAPILTKFTSSTPNGTYQEGGKISIQAVFDQALSPGSTMTVILNNNQEISLTSIDTMTLQGEYTIQGGHDVADLSVKSIKSAKIIGMFGLDATSYTIPVGKNLGDQRNIVIKTSGLPDTTGGTCKPYRLCPLSSTLQNISEYQENLICEGFITQGQTERSNKHISRLEVLELAVNMLRTEKSLSADYHDVYVDITSEEHEDTLSTIQTGLDHGLILPNSGSFSPGKSITRIEAYALLMRSVCLTPNTAEGSDVAQSIYEKAVQSGITGTSWIQFRAYGLIPRTEVFILAGKLADWADKNGGCDWMVCRK